MPKGKYGYCELGVYINTYSNFVWVTKLKNSSTGEMTVNSLEQICLDYVKPLAFMSDNGTHFINWQVEGFCDENNIQIIHTSKYAPWVNGLVESMNNLLLSHLKRLYAPNLDADPKDVDPSSIPYNWPDPLNKAVFCLNDCIILALNATPCEILFGMAFHQDSNILPMTNIQQTTQVDIDNHFTLVDSFHYDTHLRSIMEAAQGKKAFDAKA